MHQLTAPAKRRGPFLFFLSILFPAALCAQLTANFTPDKTGGCAPLSVSFTDLTSGASANVVYRWDLGNGNTSALRNPGAIYNEAKTYTVTLTVIDGTQTASRTATVTVYKKPTIDFSVTPKVCLPEAAPFTANATAGDGSISTYYWDFGDGNTQLGNSNGISHDYISEQKPG